MRFVPVPPTLTFDELLLQGPVQPFVIWTQRLGQVWITGDRMTNARYRPDPPPDFDEAVDRALREMRETYLRQRDRVRP